MHQTRINLLLILFLFACAKGQHIKDSKRSPARSKSTSVMPIRDPVPVYLAPSAKSKKIQELNAGMIVSATKPRVSDENRESEDTWIEVKLGDNKESEYSAGYVAATEASIKKNLLILTEPETEHRPILRDFAHIVEPTQPSALVKQRVNGKTLPMENSSDSCLFESNEATILTQVAYIPNEESTPDTIVWLQLKKKTGETGFVRAKHAIRASSHLLSEFERLGFQNSYGFGLPVKKDVEIFFALGEDELTIKIKSEDKKRDRELLKGLDIYAIYGELQIEGKFYYYVSRPNDDAIGEPEKYYSSFGIGLIAKENLDFYPDYLKISEKFPHKISTDKIGLFYELVGGHLNLQCSSFHAIGKKRSKFWNLIAYRGPQLVDGRMVRRDSDCDQHERWYSPVTILFELKADKLEEVARISGYRAIFPDLDGDLVPEVAIEEQLPVGHKLTIKRLTGGNLQTLAEFLSDSDIRCPEARVQKDHLYIDFRRYLGEEETKFPETFAKLEEACKFRLMQDVRNSAAISKRFVLNLKFPSYAVLKKNKFVPIKKPKGLEKEKLTEKPILRPAAPIKSMGN